MSVTNELCEHSMRIKELRDRLGDVERMLGSPSYWPSWASIDVQIQTLAKRVSEIEKEHAKRIEMLEKHLAAVKHQLDTPPRYSKDGSVQSVGAAISEIKKEHGRRIVALENRLYEQADVEKLHQRLADLERVQCTIPFDGKPAELQYDLDQAKNRITELEDRNADQKCVIDQLRTERDQLRADRENDRKALIKAADWPLDDYKDRANLISLVCSALRSRAALVSEYTEKRDQLRADRNRLREEHDQFKKTIKQLEDNLAVCPDCGGPRKGDSTLVSELADVRREKDAIEDDRDALKAAVEKIFDTARSAR